MGVILSKLRTKDVVSTDSVPETQKEDPVIVTEQSVYSNPPLLTQQATHCQSIRCLFNFAYIHYLKF